MENKTTEKFTVKDCIPKDFKTTNFAYYTPEGKVFNLKLPDQYELASLISTLQRCEGVEDLVNAGIVISKGDARAYNPVKIYPDRKRIEVSIRYAFYRGYWYDHFKYPEVWKKVIAMWGFINFFNHEYSINDLRKLVSAGLDDAKTDTVKLKYEENIFFN